MGEMETKNSEILTREKHECNGNNKMTQTEIKIIGMKNVKTRKKGRDKV